MSMVLIGTAMGMRVSGIIEATVRFSAIDRM